MSNGLVAFISGASGGIGGAIAENLAADGYSLILQYNQNKDKAVALRNSIIQKYKVEIDLVQADFSKPEETLKKVQELSINPEVIVHNSGSSKWGLFTDLTHEELSQELVSGVTTPMMLTQTFLPYLLRRKQGKIIVISSIWGITGASCEVLYSTIKGGLNSFVKALAKEVAPSNIQVNAVAPGAIDTAMIGHLTASEQQDLISEIPAGRLGTPEDVASIVSFLVSPKSNYINGQIISTNGAWYC
ncbi:MULTISPECIES: elongation factor P 5-aminopentanone reductase [Bacillaceae]|uniref:SDR family oxidoreductase n=1 Tax=Evansella alkalicola TaxID=745819 RepID=A0ABS6JWB5_9BACI|nr:MULTISPECIES: SDR family oxidoreductase [Bacillaceae]MBU9722680.1 SDR family oxidoreductase [Bacillus alkalicola]